MLVVCSFFFITTTVFFSDWTPIEAEDALELLSPAFTHPAVRYVMFLEVLQSIIHNKYKD